jgi:hypothetical protein
MPEWSFPLEERGVEFAGMERRAAVRYRCAREAGCRPLSGAEAGWLPALVRDVSTLGIGLLEPRPREPGTLLEIDLTGASGGAVTIVLARVVHLFAEAPDAWVVGCAFVRDLDEPTLRFCRAQRLRSTGPDPRRWVRFPCSVETVCDSLETTPGERVPARILNISAGGVGLMLPCAFGAGVLLDLELPTTPGQPARRLAVRVVRTVPHTAASWFHGCEFSDHLEEAEVEALV